MSSPFITSYPPTEQKNIEINANIYKRNIPDAPVDPVYSIASLSTRGTIFPISTMNPVQTSKMPLSSASAAAAAAAPSIPPFRPYQNHAPVIEYMKNVPLENKLRNQYFALQRGPMPIYVPSSASDLYRVPQFYPPAPPTRVPSTQVPAFINKHRIGTMTFNNATKAQTKMNTNVLK